MKFIRTLHHVPLWKIENPRLESDLTVFLEYKKIHFAVCTDLHTTFLLYTLIKNTRQI